MAHKGCGLLIIFYNSPGKRYNICLFFSTFFLWIPHDHFTSSDAWSPPLSWIIHSTVPQSMGIKCKVVCKLCFPYLSSHHVPQCPEEISQHLSLGCSVISIITRDTNQEVSFYHSSLCFLPQWQSTHKSAKEPWASIPFPPVSLSANFIMLC